MAGLPEPCTADGGAAPRCSVAAGELASRPFLCGVFGPFLQRCRVFWLSPVVAVRCERLEGFLGSGSITVLTAKPGSGVAPGTEFFAGEGLGAVAPRAYAGEPTRTAPGHAGRSGSLNVPAFIPAASANVFYVTVPSAGPSVCLPLSPHALPPTSFDRVVTESQSHRMVRVGRDLCGSSSPTLLPKQGHLQQAAQDLVQFQPSLAGSWKAQRLLFSYEFAAGQRRGLGWCPEPSAGARLSCGGSAGVGAASLSPSSCKPSTAPVGGGCGDSGPGSVGEGTGFGFQSYLGTGRSLFAGEIGLAVEACGFAARQRLP